MMKTLTCFHCGKKIHGDYYITIGTTSMKRGTLTNHKAITFHIECFENLSGKMYNESLDLDNLPTFLYTKKDKEEIFDVIELEENKCIQCGHQRPTVAGVCDHCRTHL